MGGARFDSRVQPSRRPADRCAGCAYIIERKLDVDDSEPPKQLHARRLTQRRAAQAPVSVRNIRVKR